MYEKKLVDGIYFALPTRAAASQMHDRITRFAGALPSELGSLCSLTDLLLGYNSLSGSIPVTLDHLDKVTSLRLASNQLSGPVVDLSSLENLTYLHLDNNQLCLLSDLDLSSIRNPSVFAAVRRPDMPRCTDEKLSATPGIPQNLTTTIGEGQVTLAWDAAENAASYDLWVWENVNRRWDSIGGVLTATTYIQSGLTEDRNYLYQVRARDGNGKRSAWSEQVYASLSGSQFPPPPPSLGLDWSYQKYAVAGGVAVIAPIYVPDSYLIRAQGVITGMFSSKPNLAAQLAAKPTYVSIEPGIRGLAQKNSYGWIAYTPQYDPYCHMMVHEIAHLVHYLLENEPFDDRLMTMYEDALGAGLWAGTYAATKYKEYWGQGVPFQLTDSFQNRYHSSVPLADYDADLAALVDEIFGATTMPASCGADW